MFLLRLLKRDFFFFFNSCNLSSSALLQLPLSKEPSETLDTSKTFDFPVSFCNSNLFRIAGLLGCLRGWRCPTSFREGFWFTFFRFYPWWVVKSLGDFFFLSRVLSFLFIFYFCFLDLKLTPFFFFFLPIDWQEVTKRFRPVKLSIGGVPPQGTPTTSSLVTSMSVE